MPAEHTQVDPTYTTPLALLAQHFGNSLGPDEIVHTRFATDKEIDNLVAKLEGMYVTGSFAFPMRQAGELRSFPAALNHRDISGFCSKQEPKPDDELEEQAYLKRLELPGEILKLLLYYDTVVIVDPLSLVFADDCYVVRDSVDRERLRNNLANAMELLVPLASFIESRNILLYPRFFLTRHLGKTVNADESECADSGYRQICSKYGIRLEYRKPVIFVGDFTELQCLKTALNRCGKGETEALLHAGLLNGYLALAHDLDAEMIAQDRWTWDVLSYKLKAATLSSNSRLQTAVASPFDGLDLTDFDTVSNDDLRTLREGEEVFAQWRADIEILVALADAGTDDYQGFINRFDQHTRYILPKRATEISSAMAQSALCKHVSDTAFAFGSTAIAGVALGDPIAGLPQAAASGVGGLLLSLLFRQPRKEEKILCSFYTMLARRDRKTGLVSSR